MKCPNCGHEHNEVIQTIKPFKNAMNHYVRKSDGKNGGVFNDDAKEIQVGPVDNKETYILAELYVAHAAKSPIIPSPEVPVSSPKVLKVTPKE